MQGNTPDAYAQMLAEARRRLAPLHLPRLARAPSAASPLPAGTVPILPTPCGVCRQEATFCTEFGTPVCSSCWARAYPPARP